MSELKAYGIRVIDGLVVESESGQLYLKSEADKVIAELEERHKMEVEQLLMEIVELKADYKEACDRLKTANLIKDEQLQATRRQKYKRCLAIALLCFKNGKEKQSVYKLKPFFWSRWGNRWWKLAEKFKEAK